MTAKLITLLTDFGLEDPYVGVMKGVLLRECPEAQLIDLTHAIAAGDCVAAGFWLERVFSWFPAGTVHLVVVDPGVGTARQALLLAAHGHYFVGPDNGILSGLMASDVKAELRAIDGARLGLALPSRTFHGRDLFAPVAARIAHGSLQCAQVGPLCEARSAPLVPRPNQSAAGWSGQILVVDRFGNLISNLVAPPARESFEIQIAGRTLPIVQTYGEGAKSQLVALVGSFGTLEVAQRDGHAARALGVDVGTPLELVRRSG